MKRKEEFLGYLLEILIVAFGVFLGIIISEYNSNRKTKENADRSLSMIVEELKTNSQKLAESIEYHEEIKNGFDSLIRSIPRDIA